MTPPTVPAPAVSLVIGSGSVKCAAALGVMKVLNEAGIPIDRVVGCSAGALFASLVALGYETTEATDITLRTWTKDLTSKPSRMGYLRLLAPKLFGFKPDNFALRDDRSMLDRLHAVFGDRRIEDTSIPLHITATDFATGELVEITKGRIVDAIRASLALPLAFSPVKLDGRLLVDGYLSDPLPLSVAMKHGSGVIVGVGFESPYQDNITSAGRFAFQLSAILANNLLKSRLAFHGMAHHCEVIMILPEFKQRVRLFDTAKVPYIVEQGEQAALQQLPYLRELLAAEQTASPAAAI
ncbi:patatin-like phospholipase family protein [Hydrogenophaga sp.]|uniref:patatin-like phospholipase family protein n=1 Tax=Hydrogenophaga sp. TaxID=1904254 RepID=UPI0025BB1E08|nr:patatin-like phospholipase family protein [Hydrogenophaga sp.]